VCERFKDSFTDEWRTHANHQKRISAVSENFPSLIKSDKMLVHAICIRQGWVGRREVMIEDNEKVEVVKLGF
jgi:hypothetical protein